MTLDTTSINRQRQDLRSLSDIWLFGYGSLIHKVDFDYLERRRANITGWQRRFWQGSHDHRGTPEAPGRVLTLVPAPGERCAGMAYRVLPAEFDWLDVREKNGYLRTRTMLRFDDGTQAAALVYVADSGNAAWLGPASDEAIARQIAASCGPSGPNRDYVFRLADALRAMNEHDAHVFSIEKEVLKLTGTAADI